MGLGNPYRLNEAAGSAREPYLMENGPPVRPFLVQAPTSVPHGQKTIKTGSELKTHRGPTYLVASKRFTVEINSLDRSERSASLKSGLAMGYQRVA